VSARLTISERQLRALNNVCGFGGQIAFSTRFPTGDGDYLTFEEMADLARRLRDAADPLPPLTVEAVAIDVGVP
jgi:hypothetical protein